MNSVARESHKSVGATVLVLARFVLAAIFIFAAYAKMRPQPGMPWTLASVRTSLAMFAMGVDSYQMLPAFVVAPFAHWLPPVELALGLWLLSGIGLRLSSILSTLAIIAFIAAMFSAYRRGLTISCGCFGPGEQIGPKTLIRDTLLFLPLSLAVSIGSFRVHRAHAEKSAASPAVQAVK
jgi:uncharacterized membrane protein YphA (DoxX/SURF4 family)